MKYCVLLRYLLVMAVLSAGLTAQSVDEVSSLKVTGIQFEVSPDIYASQNGFLQAAEGAVRRALQQGKADLLIFPEYTGVFFAFFDAPESLEGISSVEEGLSFLNRWYEAANLHDFFLAESGRAGAAMDSVWGSLAQKYGVYLLGGTYFARKADSDSSALQLRNRAVLYGPDGRRFYQQDKVYLTPFEQELLALSPGDLSSAQPVSIHGKTVAVSICRDTFFPVWEDRFHGADLWIDIKANGEVFTSEQAEIFRGALPERLEQLPGTVGMTVCLNGTFLDLLWEGPSSVIKVESGISGKAVHWLDRARTVRGEDFISVTLP